MGSVGDGKFRGTSDFYLQSHIKMLLIHLFRHGKMLLFFTSRQWALNGVNCSGGGEAVQEHTRNLEVLEGTENKIMNFPSKYL